MMKKTWFLMLQEKFILLYSCWLQEALLMNQGKKKLMVTKY